MSSRPLEIAAFLDRVGWGCAQAQAVEGDFSSRRYARLTKPDGATALLMDADADQNTPRFVAVAKILQRAGIEAPEIYAQDAARGLLLLQDFGARNVGAAIDAGEEAKPYFLRAAEILAQLHRRFDGRDAAGLDFPCYNAELFTTQAELFLDAYIPFALQRDATEGERIDFRAAWRAVMRGIEKLPQSLLLRDFMPDNLMDLPDGNLGVLDFQDAGIGAVAYDLASLCEEVRRDGGFALLPEVVAHYRSVAESPLSQDDLLRACVILSAQRHTRILGIITRLVLRTGRREKLVFLPRIRLHLAHVLREPCLLPVRMWMQQYCPV
ncbi:MAG: phosphotransferase [Alphaproteobacteria bacterium]|nr:phosphotransferase [Alphaproteobacteria bacterium]